MPGFFQRLFGLRTSFFPRPPKAGATSRLLHLRFPAGAPYADDNDLASFVGIHVRPLVPYLDLFWFTRYGATGSREVKFRFTTTQYSKIRARVEVLEAWQHGQDGCANYNYVGDLGGNRFVPGNRAAHAAERALGVYQFLSAGARLYVDSLVPNGVGWGLEAETASGYNRETPLETFHHLFCNMTTVPTWAALLHHPNNNNVVELVSDLTANAKQAADPTIVRVRHGRIHH
jgi:hypothetical protein